MTTPPVDEAMGSLQARGDGLRSWLDGEVIVTQDEHRTQLVLADTAVWQTVCDAP